MHGSAATSEALEAFIAALEAVPHSAVVTNPYRLPHRSANLRAYLSAALAQPGRRMLLVGEGFYSNRSDFIRTAVRNQLAAHADVVKQSVTRQTLDLG